MSITDHPAYKALKEKELFELRRRLNAEEEKPIPTRFEQTVYRYFEVNADLLLEKHHDYGPSNIANAPGGPLNGLRVRMHDKLARINHLIDKDLDPLNESLRDSFVDLANYAIIGLMVMDQEWPQD